MVAMVRKAGISRRDEAVRKVRSTAGAKAPVPFNLYAMDRVLIRLMLTLSVVISLWLCITIASTAALDPVGVVR